MMLLNNQRAKKKIKRETGILRQTRKHSITKLSEAARTVLRKL
jgi:hypothetical protein